MSFTPNTQVRLLNVPLDENYQNTMDFSSIEEQTNYFIGATLPNSAFTDFTYQRLEEEVRVPLNAELLYNVNYIMFQNTNYHNKWFYGFVTNIRYINPQTTGIKFKIDAIQTWLFQMHLNQCIVEREHVTDDSVGAHTLNENIEVNELICNNFYREGYSGQYYYIMNTTVDPNTATDVTSGGRYNGVLSAGRWFAWTSIDTFKEKLNGIISGGKESAIINVFMLPTELITTNENGEVTESLTGLTENVSHPKLTSCNGYTPRNKKLLTYPYCSIRVSNNNASFVEMRPERFAEATATFVIRKASNSNCVMAITPSNYNGNSDGDFRYTVELPPFPTCQWTNDPYATWLNQNGTSNGLGFIGSIASGAMSGFAIGGPAGAGLGALTGGLSSALSLIGKSVDMDAQPLSARGSTSTNTINSSLQQNLFKIEMLSVKAEQAKVIDNFFDVYGYKVAVLKTPQLRTRRYWNYIKTNDCNITGSIPKDDLTTIRNAFNRGITIWHDSDVGNYNRNNSVR
nr:MAG: major tail protein [Bacteriophage sp.]